MSHVARWLVLSLPLLAACGDEEAVSALEARVAALEATHDDGDDAGLTALQAEVAALTTRVAAAEGSLVGLGAVDVSDLEDDLAALDADLATLQTSVTAQGTQITTLSSTSSGLQGSVTAHTTQISSLDSALVTLQGSVTTHGADIAGLDADLADLAESVVVRQTAPLTLQVPSQYATLQAALDALDGLRLETQVTIRLASGSPHVAGVVIDHPDGDRITIAGATGNPDDVTLTGGIVVPAGRTLGRLDDLTLEGTTGVGVKVEAGAYARIENVRITGFATGVEVVAGRVTAILTDVDDASTGFFVWHAGSLDLQQVTILGATQAGVFADSQSLVTAYDVETADAYTGYLIRSGSTLVGSVVSAVNSTVYGFDIEGGAVLVGSNLSATLGSSGFALNGAVGRVIGLHADNNDNDGITVSRGSSMTLWGGTAGTITGNGRYGVYALGASTVDLASTTPTANGGVEVYAWEGSWVQAQSTTLGAADVTPSQTVRNAFTAVYVD